MKLFKKISILISVIMTIAVIFAGVYYFLTKPCQCHCDECQELLEDEDEE